MHHFVLALPARPYALAAALKHSVEPHISTPIKNVLVPPLRLALCQILLVTLIKTTFVPLHLNVPSFGCPTLSQRLQNGRPCVSDGEAVLGWVTSPH